MNIVPDVSSVAVVVLVEFEETRKSFVYYAPLKRELEAQVYVMERTETANQSLLFNVYNLFLFPFTSKVELDGHGIGETKQRMKSNGVLETTVFLYQSFLPCPLSSLWCSLCA